MTISRLAPLLTTLFSSSVLILLCAAWPESALAGCNINLSLKNAGTSIIQVWRNDSKVKSKGGLWRALYKGGWDGYGGVKPGGTNDGIYKATFNCGSKRRYQIKYTCKTGPKVDTTFVDYYPGANAWDTRQSLTITLGRCG